MTTSRTHICIIKTRDRKDMLQTIALLGGFTITYLAIVVWILNS